MTDQSVKRIDKRRLILDAAVRVFARRGFHTCRVGEVAAEAGVAHGLLYHYFRSKDEVLETIFRENWGALLTAIRGIEESDRPARDQIRQVSALVLRSWQHDPDLVRVLVREVARSPELPRLIGEIREAFEAIERIVRSGQERGELRRDVDPRLTSFVLYGALEEILTGWVLGQLPDGEEDVARAESTIVELACGGLVEARSAAASR